jgi:hypothetical protein
MWLVIVVGGYFTILLVGWIINRAATLRQNRASDLARREHELQQKIEQLASEKAAFERYRTDAQNGIENMAKEKALGFPWLATAYSEYFEFLEQRLARELETKKHPAKRSADAIRAVAREKAALRRENKILRELHRYYEYLFPWLIDFKGEDLDDLIRQAHEPTIVDDEEGEVDPAFIYLTAAERESQTLTRAEKFQRH